MTLVLVGPGAIGRLLAGRLYAAGLRVALLDKDPTRARILSATGIRILAPGVPDPPALRVPVHADPEALRRALGFPAYLVLCVKAYDTSAAMRHALPLLGPHTVVVSLQNGMGNVEQIEEGAGMERIVCGVTGHGATHVETGIVRHAGTGVTTVAAVDAAMHAAAVRFAAALHDAGLEARAVADWRSMLWNKLILNAAVNPLTALHQVCNGEILRRADLLERALRTAREAAAVARAAGARPAFDDPEAELRRLCERTRDNVSSMARDVALRRRTEIDAINGAVVRAAAVRGMTAPENQALLDAVRRLTPV
jgi:2-dehydropantoate 2-reductase